MTNESVLPRRRLSDRFTSVLRRLGGIVWVSQRWLLVSQLPLAASGSATRPELDVNISMECIYNTLPSVSEVLNTKRVASSSEPWAAMRRRTSGVGGGGGGVCMSEIGRRTLFNTRLGFMENLAEECGRKGRNRDRLVGGT